MNFEIFPYVRLHHKTKKWWPHFNYWWKILIFAFLLSACMYTAVVWSPRILKDILKNTDTLLQVAKCKWLSVNQMSNFQSVWMLNRILNNGTFTYIYIYIYSSYTPQILLIYCSTQPQPKSNWGWRALSLHGICLSSSSSVCHLSHSPNQHTERVFEPQVCYLFVFREIDKSWLVE